MDIEKGPTENAYEEANWGQIIESKMFLGMIYAIIYFGCLIPLVFIRGAQNCYIYKIIVAVVGFVYGAVLYFKEINGDLSERKIFLLTLLWELLLLSPIAVEHHFG